MLKNSPLFFTGCKLRPLGIGIEAPGYVADLRSGSCSFKRSAISIVQLDIQADSSGSGAGAVPSRCAPPEVILLNFQAKLHAFMHFYCAQLVVVSNWDRSGV